MTPNAPFSYDFHNIFKPPNYIASWLLMSNPSTTTYHIPNLSPQNLHVPYPHLPIHHHPPLPICLSRQHLRWQPPPPRLPPPLLPTPIPNPLAHAIHTWPQSDISKLINRSKLHTPALSPIPKSHIQALQDPHWKSVMFHEYNTLIENKTWFLVPCPIGVNVVRSMWIYKTQV